MEKINNPLPKQKHSIPVCLFNALIYVTNLYNNLNKSAKYL